jgi:hypothetical protein
MSRMNLDDSILSAPLIKSRIKYGVTVLNGTANATLDEDMGPVIIMTPTANRVLTLPVVTADLRGMAFYFINQAAFTLTINNQAAGAVAVVPATVGATGMVVCLGDGTLPLGGWVGGL